MYGRILAPKLGGTEEIVLSAILSTGGLNVGDVVFDGGPEEYFCFLLLKNLLVLWNTLAVKDFLATGEELLEGYSTDGEVEEVTAPSTCCSAGG